MKLSEKTKSTALDAILHALSQGGLGRRELIARAEAAVTVAERSAPNPTLRSYIGSRIDALVANGELSLKGGLYALSKKPEIVIRQNECRRELLTMLARTPMRRERILKRLGAKFGTDRTIFIKDDKRLAEMIDTLLESLTADGTLIMQEGFYTKPKHRTASEPSAELFRAALYERLHDKGGSFFERFVAGALEKYYRMTGREVSRCEVLGGSNDGGIDIVIDTTDGLGFEEHVLIQTKCRTRIHTTETEIRAFYGALHAEEGTRGIFVTTASFHEGAQALLDRLPNCVGIDGDKLFEILTMTMYGIRKTKSGYTYDEAVFEM